MGKRKCKNKKRNPIPFPSPTDNEEEIILLLNKTFRKNRTVSFKKGKETVSFDFFVHPSFFFSPFTCSDYLLFLSFLDPNPTFLSLPIAPSPFSLLLQPSFPNQFTNLLGQVLSLLHPSVLSLLLSFLQIRWQPPTLGILAQKL